MNKNKSLLEKPTMVVIVAVLCCLLWGSAFPCIKLGYQLFDIPSGDSSSQILFAGIRFTLAGILVILAGSMMQGKLLKPSKTAIPKVLKLCMFQTVLQYIFFYIGLAHITGVKGSIVNAVNVFFTILVSCLLFRLEKLDRQKLIGCIIGFAGVIIVNLGGEFDMSFTFLGDGFLMISAFAYALSSVLIKIYGKDENPVMLSGYQFAAGGLIMILAGLAMGGRLNAVTFQGILLLLYMAFISAGAYTLWSLLLKYNPVSKVAVFGFCTPIFGVILSAVILGESTSFQLKTLIALMFVCVGIIIVNYKKKQENFSR
ncbi:MAG: DMT family transporter [Lachnospiraceae bacterium]|nr:DMT family transporter [Lachnospiraceae bacterium]